jgi:acid phosphatase
LTDKKWTYAPDRRHVIGGLAGTGIVQVAAPTLARQRREVDRFLSEKINHVVVIYAENRSFNNLFSNFPGLAHPLSAVALERLLQRDRDGTVLKGLPPMWGGLVPTPQTLDGMTHEIGQGAINGLANGPFALRTPEGALLPHGLVTRDLVHAFYHNQLQINGGRMTALSPGAIAVHW